MRHIMSHPLETAQGSPFWEPDWGEKFLDLNDDGFRDRQRSIEKEEGVYRIAVIGDSYTFGWLIDDPNDRYTNILNGLLNSNIDNTGTKNIRHFEVFNFSIPGIGPEEEFEIYNQFVKKYNIDLVILGLLPNDILHKKDEGVVPDIPIPEWILKNSYFTSYLVREKMIHDFKQLKWVDDYFDSIHSAYGDSNQLDYFINNIVSFRDTVNENNSDFLAVLFPIFFDFYNNPLDAERLIIIRSFEDNNIGIIDLFPYFEGRNVKELIVNDFDPHPNESAHSIISNVLYEELSEDVLGD